MANTEKNEKTPVSNEQLAEAVKNLADIAQQERDEGKIKQIPLSKAKIQTPWNPTGEKKRPTFRRKSLMNGYRLHESRMSAEEIALFNQLKAGKYHNGKWIVFERDAGTTNESVDLYVPNRTPEQRLDTARLVGNEGLVAILRMIVEEQRAA